LAECNRGLCNQARKSQGTTYAGWVARTLRNGACGEADAQKFFASFFKKEDFLS